MTNRFFEHQSVATLVKPVEESPNPQSRCQHMPVALDRGRETRQKPAPPLALRSSRSIKYYDRTMFHRTVRQPPGVEHAPEGASGTKMPLPLPILQTADPDTNGRLPKETPARPIHGSGLRATTSYCGGDSSSRPRLAGSIPQASTAAIWITSSPTMSDVTPLTP